MREKSGNNIGYLVQLFLPQTPSLNRYCFSDFATGAFSVDIALFRDNVIVSGYRKNPSIIIYSI